MIFWKYTNKLSLVQYYSNTANRLISFIRIKLYIGYIAQILTKVIYCFGGVQLHSQQGSRIRSVRILFLTDAFVR